MERETDREQCYTCSDGQTNRQMDRETDGQTGLGNYNIDSLNLQKNQETTTIH